MIGMPELELDTCAMLLGVTGLIIRLLCIIKTKCTAWVGN